MTDYHALIQEALSYPEIGEGPVQLTLHRLAETVAALAAEVDVSHRGLDSAQATMAGLVVERDALWAQLDGMTTEWGTSYSLSADPGFAFEEYDSEEQARQMLDDGDRLIKRLVGPWVEVTD